MLPSAIERIPVRMDVHIKSGFKPRAKKLFYIADTSVDKTNKFSLLLLLISKCIMDTILVMGFGCPLPKGYAEYKKRDGS